MKHNENDHIMDRDNRLFDLLMNKMDNIHDDMKERVENIHDELRVFNQKFEQHLEDDKELARDVWMMKKVFTATWAGIGLGITSWLGWKGIKG